MKTIATYASVSNVKAKIGGELKEKGPDSLSMGVNSASEGASSFVNSHIRAEACQQLNRLDAAGIKYSLGIMVGLREAGHGQKTARIIGRFYQGLNRSGSASCRPPPCRGLKLARSRDVGEYPEILEYEGGPGDPGFP